MEKSKRLPPSIRKYIRKHKARIRREFLDKKKQQEAIEKIYQDLGVPFFNREQVPKRGLSKEG